MCYSYQANKNRSGGFTELSAKKGMDGKVLFKMCTSGGYTSCIVRDSSTMHHYNNCNTCVYTAYLCCAIVDVKGLPCGLGI